MNLSRKCSTHSADPTECAKPKENVAFSWQRPSVAFGCLPPAGIAAPREYTVPAQCPRSARTVPATVPAWKTKQCPRFLILKGYRGFRFLYRNERTAGTALFSRRALSRALCGHCAGTARALCIPQAPRSQQVFTSNRGSIAGFRC